MRPAWLDLNADETAEDLALPAEVRVKQGMALLDAKVPGWEQRIDVETLDVSQSCHCIIGQLYGDYDFWAPPWIWTGAHTPPDLGLHTPVPWVTGLPKEEQPRTADFAALTVAWKHAILARRMEATS